MASDLIINPRHIVSIDYLTLTAIHQCIEHHTLVQCWPIISSVVSTLRQCWCKFCDSYRDAGPELYQCLPASPDLCCHQDRLMPHLSYTVTSHYVHPSLTYTYSLCMLTSYPDQKTRDVEPMLGQRHRRYSNIRPTWDQRMVFNGWTPNDGLVLAYRQRLWPNIQTTFQFLHIKL